MVFTGLNGSTKRRGREALKLYVHLIRFSISAGDFCTLFSLDILIKMTVMQFLFYKGQCHKLNNMCLVWLNLLLTVTDPLQPLMWIRSLHTYNFMELLSKNMLNLYFSMKERTPFQ